MSAKEEKTTKKKPVEIRVKYDPEKSAAEMPPIGGYLEIPEGSGQWFCISCNEKVSRQNDGQEKHFQNKHLLDFYF